jgi:hypothetical protein
VDARAAFSTAIMPAPNMHAEAMHELDMHELDMHESDMQAFPASRCERSVAARCAAIFYHAR